MLSDSVTNFARRVELARMRKLHETKKGCDRKVWSQMAELGWLDVLVPEQYGGMGLQLADMAILAQGLARMLVCASNNYATTSRARPSPTSA